MTIGYTLGNKSCLSNQKHISHGHSIYVNVISSRLWRDFAIGCVIILYRLRVSELYNKRYFHIASNNLLKLIN